MSLFIVSKGHLLWVSRQYFQYKCGKKWNKSMYEKLSVQIKNFRIAWGWRRSRQAERRIAC
jgi:hypothetical protein